MIAVRRHTLICRLAQSVLSQFRFVSIGGWLVVEMVCCERQCLFTSHFRRPPPSLPPPLPCPASNYPFCQQTEGNRCWWSGKEVEGRPIKTLHRRLFNQSLPQAGLKITGHWLVSRIFPVSVLPVCLARDPEKRLIQCCFTSTETIRLTRDGEARTATSTFTQLLSSARLRDDDDEVELHVLGCRFTY